MMRPIIKANLRLWVLNSSTHIHSSPSQPFSVRRMYSQQPSWLKSILDDSNPAPRLFAWDLSNIESSGTPGPSPNPDGDLDRRIFVLGVGNLGRLFASSLAQAPDRPPITLVVHRKELLTEYMASEGIEILRNGILEKLKVFGIEWWTEAPPGHGPVREVYDGKKLRNLIVATKAAAALPQIDRVRRYLDRDSTIVFAQNGMSKLWPPHGLAYASHRYNDGEAPDFLACVTTHGVTSQGPFKSFHASQADVAIGPVLTNSNLNYLTNQITEAPYLDARSVPRADLWVLQLEKLVINAVINPLTAILGCKNGALFVESNGVVEIIIDQLLAEASKVLQALVSHESSADIIAKPLSTYGSQSSINVSVQELVERFSQPRLRDLVYKVGHKVRENTSSMLQDVRAGKPTEVRDFNGWIVETAAFLDQSLDVRGHQALIGLVESGSKLDVDQLGVYFHSSGCVS